MADSLSIYCGIFEGLLLSVVIAVSMWVGGLTTEAGLIPGIASLLKMIIYSLVLAVEGIVAIISCLGLIVSFLMLFVNELVLGYQHHAGLGMMIGGMIILFAFFGFYGARAKKERLLSWFTYGLIFAVFIETVCLFFTFFGNSVIDLWLKENAVPAIKAEYGKVPSKFDVPDGSSFTKMIDDFQILSQCCGFYNGSDFADGYFDKLSNTTNPWPESCCKRYFPQSRGEFIDLPSCLMVSNVSSKNSYAAKGCYYFLEELKKEFYDTAAYTVLAAFIIQIILIISGCCLASKIKQQRSLVAG